MRVNNPTCLCSFPLQLYTVAVLIIADNMLQLSLIDCKNLQSALERNQHEPHFLIAFCVFYLKLAKLA